MARPETGRGQDWKRNYTAIPRILEGEEVVYVLGGGPSLRNYDPEELRGQRIIVTNEAFALHPEADALVFVDVGWWQRRKGAVLDVWEGGLLIGRGNYRKLFEAGGCKNVAYRSGVVWSTEPEVLGGKNSGLAAINAAWLMGAKRAVLLGFDMKPVEGRNNYHSIHPVSGKPNYTHRYVQIFIPEIAKASEMVEKVGFVVINATEGSALTCFPKRSLDWCRKMYG
jgi:hypothetical protein